MKKPFKTTRKKRVFEVTGPGQCCGLETRDAADWLCRKFNEVFEAGVAEGQLLAAPGTKKGGPRR